MQVNFTQEFSIEAAKKFDVLTAIESPADTFFSAKSYGCDLKVLYIGVSCFSPKFEHLFKLRKPKYRPESSVYVHRGVEIHREAKDLEYELRLDYDRYMAAADIRPLLVGDVLDSLLVISTIRKIKDFDLKAFTADFKLFFESQHWL